MVLKSRSMENIFKSSCGFLKKLQKLSNFIFLTVSSRWFPPFTPFNGNTCK